MKRVLYVYPEEWGGQRGREIHTLETCLAMAEAGLAVTLVTGGGFGPQRILARTGRDFFPAGFTAVNLSRHFGPLHSAAIFGWNFTRWLGRQTPFDLGYAIHPKGAAILARTGLPYAWEAHEILAGTPASGSAAGEKVAALEQASIANASALIATNPALAEGLNARYWPESPRTFHVVPHGCRPPYTESTANPNGPLVYVGTLRNRSLLLALEAAAQAKIPVQLVGGTREEWNRLNSALSRPAANNIKWKAYVASSHLGEELRGMRAGLCPAPPETGLERCSLPMKIFDYARCGLPVASTDLVSLRSLKIGSWCHPVRRHDAGAWTQALGSVFDNGEAAREWAVNNTWRHRGEKLREILDPA